MATNSIRLAPNLCPSLTKEVYDKFIDENITNSIDLLSRNPEELSAKLRISFKIIQNICKVLYAYHGAFQQSGLDLYREALSSSVIISTGHKCLDKLLNGGILTGELVEICGAPGVGKTSFCLSLSFEFALRQKRNILYIDPAHSIQSSLIMTRIAKLEGQETNIQEILSSVCILHPNNIWELLQILEEVSNGERKEFTKGKKWDFLIVDALPQLIFPLLGGSQYESFGVLNHLGKILTKLVRIQKMAAIVVNSGARSSADENCVPPNFPVKPALGRHWTHVPHTRLFFETSLEHTAPNPSNADPSLSSSSEGDGDTLVHVIKSSRSKCGSCAVHIF